MKTVTKHSDAYNGAG